VNWHWLTSAPELAGAAGTRLLPDPVPPGWACFPRIATSTPTADGSSIAAARGFTVATLQRWDLAERSDDVSVVVSELLTNALRHAQRDPADPPPGWPIRLGLLHPGPWVICAVSDPSVSVPVLAEAGYLAEHGRGLRVISALSDKWGCTVRRDRGKVVWALFSTDGRPAGDGWV
jgi:hypothetical protein